MKLVRYMGDDLAAVESARVSYNNIAVKEDRNITPKDKELLKYLMSHEHYSPFEHLTFTLHMKMPIFIARQFMRYRHISVNEISRRYTDKQADEFYIPDHIRVQNLENKQSSYFSKNPDLTQESIKEFEYVYEYAYRSYQRLLAQGVAREMARMVLPVGQYTEFYVTMNFRALMHILNQRADSHAQWEIQEYAIAMAKILRQIYPQSYKLFIDISYLGDNEQL